jgi:hypothetical protein
MMDELVKGLRKRVADYEEISPNLAYYGPTSAEFDAEVADALIAQAEKIAELERFAYFYRSQTAWYSDHMHIAVGQVDSLSARVKELEAALKACLNYIENTEAELGITLISGDAARAALAGEQAPPAEERT